MIVYDGDAGRETSGHNTLRAAHQSRQMPQKHSPPGQHYRLQQQPTKLPGSQTEPLVHASSAEGFRGQPSILDPPPFDSVAGLDVNVCHQRWSGRAESYNGGNSTRINHPCVQPTQWLHPQTVKLGDPSRHASGLPGIYASESLAPSTPARGIVIASGQDKFKSSDDRGQLTPSQAASNVTLSDADHSFFHVSAESMSGPSTRLGDEDQIRLRKRPLPDDESEDDVDKALLLASRGQDAEARKKGGKYRATQACDKCREQKCKCIPDTEHPGTCTQCVLLGVSCTFRGPSMKRGPPKGYLAAVINRLETMEDTILAKLAEHSDDERARDLLRELIGETALKQTLSGRLRFSQQRDKLPRSKKGAGPHGITWQDSWWVATPGVPSRPATGVSGSKGLSHRFGPNIGAFHPATVPVTSERTESAGTDTCDPLQHERAFTGMTPPLTSKARSFELFFKERNLGSAQRRPHDPVSSSPDWHNHGAGERPIDTSMLEGEPQFSSAGGELLLNGTLSALYKTSQHNKLYREQQWFPPTVELWAKDIPRIAHATPDSNSFLQCVAPYFPAVHPAHFDLERQITASDDGEPAIAHDFVAIAKQVMAAIASHDAPVMLPKETMNILLTSARMSLLRASSLLLLAYSACGHGQELQARNFLSTALVIAHANGVHRCCELVPDVGLGPAQYSQRSAVWMCCVILDKILAGAGHPPLIDPSFCDAEPDLPQAGNSRSSPFHHLYLLCAVLDDICRSLYSSDPIRASVLDSLERRLTQCYYDASAYFGIRHDDDQRQHSDCGTDNFGPLNLLFHQAYVQLHSRFVTAERQRAALSSALSAAKVAAALGEGKQPPWILHSLFVVGSELLKAFKGAGNVVASYKLRDSLEEVKSCLRTQTKYWQGAKIRLLLLDGCSTGSLRTDGALSGLSGTEASFELSGWSDAEHSQPHSVLTLGATSSSDWRSSVAQFPMSYGPVFQPFPFNSTLAPTLRDPPLDQNQGAQSCIATSSQQQISPAITKFTEPNAATPSTAPATTIADAPLEIMIGNAGPGVNSELAALHGFANVATSGVSAADYIFSRSTAAEDPEIEVRCSGSLPLYSSAAPVSASGDSRGTSLHQLFACTSSELSVSGLMSWDRRSSAGLGNPSALGLGAPWFNALAAHPIMTSIGPDASTPCEGSSAITTLVEADGVPYNSASTMSGMTIHGVSEGEDRKDPQERGCQHNFDEAHGEFQSRTCGLNSNGVESRASRLEQPAMLAHHRWANQSMSALIGVPLSDPRRMYAGREDGSDNRKEEAPMDRRESIDTQET